MKNTLLLALFCFSIFSCRTANKSEPHVIINTSLGDIEVALYPEKAPKTVKAFLENIKAGVYKDAVFYRVLKDENVPPEYNTGLIQGGMYNNHHAQERPFIEHESPKQTGIMHESGTISMARTTPGSASTEFFICIGDQKQFDSSNRGNSDGLGYAAFGRVVKGMPVVRKIQNKRSSGDRFDEPIRINNIEEK